MNNHGQKRFIIDLVSDEIFTSVEERRVKSNNQSHVQTISFSKTIKALGCFDENSIFSLMFCTRETTTIAFQRIDLRVEKGQEELGDELPFPHPGWVSLGWSTGRS